ncbi:M43 family zinc metalloprotease [Maribellus sediminis]|uniref:M43 family zinc metalloprotease n=1 Tax=Maribellus sediminis TaxID=2696285 RepID=UPI00142F4839|nr:M43 family zinc metalloprotease [Maribellus sediminis]
MKYLLLTLISFSCAISSFSQNCFIEDTTVVPDLKSGTNYFVPGSPLKCIRVIVHFIQKDDGTGNFNENDDGLTPSNNFSGYDFAKYILNYANNLLDNNQEMRLQPFGLVPVYDPGYRYKLSGVFFWRNTTLYNDYGALNCLQASYGQSTNDTINIFITSLHGNTGGYVRYIGDNAVLLFKPYTNYIASVNNNNNWYNRASAIVINHEVGHCLNLYHTLMTNSGTCKASWDDFCDDTPSIQQMLDINEPSPCCWNDVHCSNNLMDYNADQQSITPDQLEHIHSALNIEKLNFCECNYYTTTLNINSFNNSSGTYVAKNIIVSGSSAVVKTGKTVYLESDGITFNTGFEVQAGGKLNVLVNSDCNQ